MFVKATLKDTNALCDLFLKTLREHKSYISHGEMQMGVALSNDEISDDAEKKWTYYIRKKINNRSTKYPSVVLKYLDEGKIVAFGVFEVSADGDKPFGIIGDMVVLRKYRGSGLGKKLLDEGLQWFAAMGIDDIYLESGLHNESAHRFFEKNGFERVSYIFKLKR